MKKCVLVIEASPSEVRAAAFSAGSPEVMEEFSYGPDSLASSFRQLSEDLGGKGLKPVKTLLSIHSSCLSLKLLDIPVADRTKLREIISLQSEELFLKGTESMAIDGLPLPGGKAIAAGVDKSVLAAQLKALSDAGLEASWAGPALLCKGSLFERVAPGQGVAALIDADSITVAKDGKAFFFKHLDSVDDLLLSIAALEADGVRIERYFTAGGEGLLRQAGVDAGDAGCPVYPSLEAVWLRYREGLKESVDFLKMHEDPGAEPAMKRRLSVTALLAASLVLSWGVYAYLRYQNISAESASIDKAMESGYAAVFPAEKPKDPGYALEIKLKALSEDTRVLLSRTDALGSLLALSEAAPAGGRLRALEVRSSGASLQLSGEAGSFEEAASFRESVLKTGRFSKAAITETKPAPGVRVRFGLSAERSGQ